MKFAYWHCLPAMILFLLGVSSPTLTVLAQEATPQPPVRTLYVLSQDARNFPDISFDLLVQEDNHAITGLTASNFSLSEPHENLRVEPTYDQATVTVIIVDLSSSSDDDLIRSTLSAYMSQSYQEGDILAFYIVAGDASSFQEIADREQAEALVNTLSSTGELAYSIAPALEGALGYLQLHEQATPDLNSQAIVVSSYLYDVRIGTVARLFDEAHIPIHVIQSHRFRQSSSPDMQRLADTSGGTFVDNQNGQYVFQQNPNTPAVIGALADLFNLFKNNRLTYQLSYRSQSQSLSQTRTVEVTAILPDGSQISDSFAYEPTFANPQLTIIAPTNLNPTRTVGDNGIFERNEETIVVRVAFPDVPRSITRVQLEAVDQTTGEALQAPIEILNIEQDEAGNLLIPWSLEPYSAFGESYPITLKITVIDELGLTASASQNALVSVGVPPIQATVTPLPTFTTAPTYTPLPTFTAAPTYTPLPTLTDAPTATSLPTYTPFPTPTVAAVVAIRPTLPPLEAASSDNPSDEFVEGYNRFAVVALGVLGINLIGMILFLRRTGTGQRIASQGAAVVRTAVYRAKTSVFKQASGSGSEASENKTLAKLVVLRGLAGIEFIAIDRVRFIIGRETAAGCNYAIPIPHVSSQHFTIFYKNNVFTIMDMNSANGTYLNGHKLIPNREYPLQDAARILIVNDVEFEFQPIIEQLEATQRYSPSESPTPQEPPSSTDTEQVKSSEGRRAGGLRTRFSELTTRVENGTESESVDQQQRNWQSLPPKESGTPDANKKRNQNWDPFELDE